MTQLNTPYPSTAYLTGFLRLHGFEATQADLSLALALKLLSVDGLQAIHAQVQTLARKRQSVTTRFFVEHFDSYHATIGPAVRFLQGRDPSLAHRIASRRYLAEGPRFSALEHFIDEQQQEADALDWAFGALGLQDRGVLEAGMRADFVLWDVQRPAELSYAFGSNPRLQTVFKGQIL